MVEKDKSKDLKVNKSNQNKDIKFLYRKIKNTINQIHQKYGDKYLHKHK